jgi:hypothetical protein
MIVPEMRQAAAVITASTMCFLAGALVAPGVTKVNGNTEKWTGGENYEPLPEVKIVVTRQGSFVKETKSEGAAAAYELEIRSGEPIDVTFHLSKDYVPETESLSAKDGTNHRVTPALMTVEQYRKLETAGRLPPLSDKIRLILRRLPQDSRVAQVLEEMLSKLR